MVNMSNSRSKIIVFVVIAIILIAVPLAYLSTNQSDKNDNQGSAQTLITVEGENYTLNELESMETISGMAKYQNRFGNWNEEAEYVGVSLSELISDMERNDVVEVTASDGYTQNFSYEQIFPNDTREELQGEIILAYQKDDSKVPDWEAGPRIAVLPEDKEFSNQDLQLTKSLGKTFETQTSAGSLWAKNVENIELKEDVFSESSKTVTLNGTTKHEYTMSQIKDFETTTGEGGYLTSTGEVRGPYEYKGVKLTKLISNVHSEGNYSIEVVATDGYTMTYSEEQTQGTLKVYDQEGNLVNEEGNLTLLLAYEIVGDTELQDGPRIVAVGEEPKITDSGIWAKLVEKINIKPPQKTEEALVTVQGEDYTLEDLESMTTTTGQAKYQNRFSNWNQKSTYTGVPLNKLIENMDQNDVVKITASDGYSQKFSYDQVFPSGVKEQLQGQIILAYQKGDSKVPDWEAGPRIAVLPEDKEFSNQDLQLTKSLGKTFETQTSAGSLWAKNVENIELKEDVFSESSKTVTLNGTTKHEYTMSQIKDFETTTGEGGYLTSTGEVRGPYEYKGVKLTKLISNVHSEGNYSIEVVATDGYTMTYSEEQTQGTLKVYDQEGNLVNEEGNLTLLLAYEIVGDTELQDGPRIVAVGEEPKITDSGIWAKLVEKINIKPPQKTEEALVTVQGEDYTLEDLESMTTTTGQAKYQNRFSNWNQKSTYTGVPLNKLIENMDQNDVVKITASDGYSQKFSYDQVFPSGVKEQLQGQIILAYQKNDIKAPEWGDGPRIAVLPEDEEFSNQDHKLTKSLVSDFDSQTSASSLWVKKVENIELNKKPNKEDPITITLNGTTTHKYTLSQIKNISSTTGKGGFLTSTEQVVGPYEYEGVKLTKLISNAYLGGNYTLEVTAADGYTMTYTKQQVEGKFKIYNQTGSLVEEQGNVTLLLAYDIVGDTELKEGPRIVMVDEEPKITLSHFWAKLVRDINIKPTQKSWTLDMSGISNMTVDDQYFLHAATCEQHRTTITDGEDEYSGMPLWILVSAIDGADPKKGHYMFNSDLANKGYNVTITATDGYSIKLSSKTIARNNSIIVANQLNGETLPEEDFPLRLIGKGLPGSKQISKIASIKLTDVPDIPKWNITLNGTVSWDMKGSVFNSMIECRAHTAYYNYTEDGTTYSYKGTPLYNLVGAVDDMEQGDHWTFNDTLAQRNYNVTVIAKDGYSYTFSSKQIARNDSIIIASQLNGEPLPEDSAPLRIVGEGLSGFMEVGRIAEIRLTGLEKEPKETWEVTLNGSVKTEIEAEEFSSLFSQYSEYHNYTEEGTSYSYRGITLSHLVGAVDDEKKELDYSLNETLASKGYNVSVIAEDGYSYTFDIQKIANDDSIIVASELNGEPLPEEDAPLKLVGEDLSGFQQVTRIAEIRLTDLPQEKEKQTTWNVTLDGLRKTEITNLEFESRVNENPAYHNYTEDGTTYSYRGTPLYSIVAAVDDQEQNWVFNETLAEKGYEVSITATDGYTISFSSERISNNDSIILANQLNGEPLPEEDKPLRVMGEGLESSMTISKIAKIQLTNIEQ